MDAHATLAGQVTKTLQPQTDSPRLGSFRLSAGIQTPVACKDPVVVVCATDDDYSLPLGVALFSMIEHLDRNSHVDLFILGLKLSLENKNRLQRVLSSAGENVKSKIIDVDDALVKSLRIRSYVTPAAYLRLFIPDILGPTYKKAIYFDCDVLVMKDISELWNCCMGGKVLLAATTYGANRVSDPGHVHNWKELGIPSDSLYFNSGVLVIDLEQWRSRDLTTALIDYVVEYKDTMNYHDQGTLNAVCHDLWRTLDPKWNVMANNFTRPHEWPNSAVKSHMIEHWDELWNRPSICHFTTHWKPWTPGHRPHHQDAWFSAFKRSGWYTAAEYFEWMFQWTAMHYCRGIARKAFHIQVTDRNLAAPIRPWRKKK